MEEKTGTETSESGKNFEAAKKWRDNRLDTAYDEALKDSETTEAMKSLIIKLTAIPEGERKPRLKKLKSKLEEYTARLKGEWEDSEYFPFDSLNPSTRYKRDILRLVLKMGTLNTWALLIAIGETDYSIDLPRFGNACDVIEDYITTGGKKLRGGTGLK